MRAKAANDTANDRQGGACRYEPVTSVVPTMKNISTWFTLGSGWLRSTTCIDVHATIVMIVNLATKKEAAFNKPLLVSPC